MENMKNQTKPKNLIEGGEEKTPSTPEKNAQSVESFLDMTGMEWEKKGRGIYVYPSSIQEVKKLLDQMPAPSSDGYVVIPLGSIGGYTVFILMSRNGTTLRIGYGRGNIPYSETLNMILEKLNKIAKDLEVQSRKNGKNLLGV